VLHVTHYCAPHIGGLETVVSAETVRLAARGWRVGLVSSAWGVRAGTRVDGGVRTTRVRAWGGLETRFGVPFPLFSPWLLVVLWREVRRADLVHIHDPLYVTSWVAALWCRVLARPYVVHRHVGFVHHSSLVVRAVQRMVLGTVGRLVLGGANALLPIDTFVAESVRAETDRPERIRVLRNGVDTTRYRPAERDEREVVRRELGLPTDLPLLLFVGRFVPKKGFPLVAAAAADDYRIVFAGGDRPDGLDDERLVFLGSLPPDELARIYRCVDAFVVASVGECPLTVLEAMSSALPVLVNDDPALHSPWTAGPGVRFVDMAGGGLADAAAELLGDLALARRLGADAHGVVRREFSWDVHTDALEAIYRETLAE
jgi:glycosyltransferase involved in cell wall biosynthesis